jgi:hypothetical protein
MLAWCVALSPFSCSSGLWLVNSSPLKSRVRPCAAPPPNITIRKMIVKGTTFSEYFHTPFLGSGQVDP